MNYFQVYIVSVINLSTGVLAEAASAHIFPTLEVDRPFFFALCSDKTKSLLFSGQVVAP